MLSQLFSPSSLSQASDLSEIRFANEQNRARAEWEWFVFGLYATVLAVRSRFVPEIAKTIVHELFPQIHFHLVRAGATESELAVKLSEVKQRFAQFDAITQTGELERLGFAAATFLLGLDSAPGDYLYDRKGFAFGLAANVSFTGALNAVNEMFDKIKVVT